MKIYKITEASEYLGVSINTLKTLANNNKINSFKTSGSHRRFRQDDLDSYMGVKKEKQDKLTIIYARCSTHKQKASDDANKIYEEARKALEPIFNKWSKQGYSFREISHIISGMVHMLRRLKFRVDLGNGKKRKKEMV